MGDGQPCLLNSRSETGLPREHFGQHAVRSSISMVAAA
jgi:hypothetical protein